MLNRDKTLLGIVMAVLLVFSYYVGKWNTDRSDKEILLQERLDQAKRVDSAKTADYKKLSDSLTIENDFLQQQNNQINAIKQLIRNEIKNTSKKIDALRDSDVQHYVDSIRAASGFN